METEIKIEIHDVAGVRARLADIGATFLGEVEEDNQYYDRDDELAERGESLRLRQDARARLTWKGRSSFDGGVVERPEIEIEVSSFADAAEIISRLGFQLTDRLAKRRETWRLGPVEIAIDTLAFGTFVEFEGPAEEALIAAAQLGLDPAQGIAHSYRRLKQRRSNPT
jgi:adenylate cyclase class 2